MTFFRRPKRRIPSLNMTSLPDLIFTVLFFFIIVTHMREVTLKVKYHVPEGTELTKTKKSRALIHIYIGPPADHLQRFSGTDTHIQINDKYVSADEVTDYISEICRPLTPEERENITVAIKADRQTSMETIIKVKQALRKAGVLRISYSATSRNDNTDIKRK